MGEYRRDVFEAADVPPWDATIRGEKQGGSPESSNGRETEARAPQRAWSWTRPSQRLSHPNVSLPATNRSDSYLESVVAARAE
jgi:hypothetical protein